MSQHSRFDASRSLTALEQDSTIIAVIEMSQTKWLIAALVPGVERQPLKKFDAQEEMLLKLLHRCRREAGQAGRNIKRIVVAFEGWPRRVLARALACHLGRRFRESA
jgi:transposase